jgi:phosphoglycerate dehydrogenase-like enzyme
MTWALILGGARNLVAENTSLRNGGWQRFVGDDMAGQTLGVLGVGNVGGSVAQIGKAFGMKVIAWSQNLTAERAAEVGAEQVSKEDCSDGRMSSLSTSSLVVERVVSSGLPSLGL